jgi:hypothetical protein
VSRGFNCEFGIVRAHKRGPPRGCRISSFRKRAYVGCYSPADYVLGGDEMLAMVARKLARRSC